MGRDNEGENELVLARALGGHLHCLGLGLGMCCPDVYLKKVSLFLLSVFSSWGRTYAMSACCSWPSQRKLNLGHLAVFAWNLPVAK